MKRSRLWMLIVAAALSAWVAYRILQRRAAAGRPDARAGAALLPFDINDVAAIRIRAGAKSLDVVRRENRWLVASLYDYPAEYERLAGRLIELAELKIGQIVPGGEEDLAEFGLDEKSATARVEFEAADGRRLARLTLGKTREGRGGPYGGFPDGQYVRVDEGPVVLMGRLLSGFDGEARDWIKTDLLNVSAGVGSVVQVETGETAYRLKVSDGHRVELEDLGAEEKLDEAAARRVVNALQYLNFQTVADPAKSDEDLGFVSPSRYALTTPEGFTYTVALGGPAENGGRYARIAAAFAAPPSPKETAETKSSDAPPSGEADGETAAATPKTPEAPKETPEAVAERNAKKAAEEHERLSRWTYVLSTWAAESLSLPRIQLIAPPKSDEQGSDEKKAEDAEPSAEETAGGESEMGA